MREIIVDSGSSDFDDTYEISAYALAALHKPDYILSITRPNTSTLKQLMIHELDGLNDMVAKGYKGEQMKLQLPKLRDQINVIVWFRLIVSLWAAAMARAELLNQDKKDHHSGGISQAMESAIDSFVKTLCMVALFCLCSPLYAQTSVSRDTHIWADDLPSVELEPGTAWSFTLENDLFALQDNGYTNGLEWSWAKGPFNRFSRNNLPGWLLSVIENTYIATIPDRRRAVDYAIAQIMQTPDDLDAVELQVSERSYSGLLIAQVRLHAANDTWSDSLSLGLGVIGPLSLAEQSQTLMHQWTGSAEPKGWANQLNNEAVFLIEASRGKRVFSTPAQYRIEFDIILRGSVAVGTLYSSVSGATILRIGNELAISHPTATVLPQRQSSTLAFSKDNAWFAFVGADVSAMANDIFVNGNTFSSSHSLPMKHQRTRLAAGISWNLGKTAYTVSYAESRQYGDPDPFGSFSVTRRFD